MATLVRRRPRPKSARSVRIYDRCIENDIDTDVSRRAAWELGRQPLADTLGMANAYEWAAQELTTTAADHAHARAVTDLLATEKVLRTNADLRDTIEADSDQMAYDDVGQTDTPTPLSAMDRRRFGLDHGTPRTYVKRRRPISSAATWRPSSQRSMRVVPELGVDGDVVCNGGNEYDIALQNERNRALQIASDRERLWQKHWERMDAIADGTYEPSVDVHPYQREAMRALALSPRVCRDGRAGVLDDLTPETIQGPRDWAARSLVEDLARLGSVPKDQVYRLADSERRLEEARLFSGGY
jgi:hypothetical protein